MPFRYPPSCHFRIGKAAWRRASANSHLSYPGKIAAQCSHATLACYKAILRQDAKSPVLRRWERQGQAKVALQVKSEDELMELQAKAMSLGIVAEVIADAG